MSHSMWKAAQNIEDATDGRDGQAMGYDRSDIIAHGYTPMNRKVLPCMPHYQARQVAIETNTPFDAFTAFRLTDGTWEAFTFPGRSVGEGFKDAGLLP